MEEAKASYPDITGAQIATQDEQGEDLGNLALATGSLTYSNLSDTEYSNNNGVSGSGDTVSLQLENSASYSKTKTPN